MIEENKPKIQVFQIYQDAFSFLGNENILTESSDFHFIWDNFFQKGGYTPILPYATDDKPINIWYTNANGEAIYMQGLFVANVDNIPDGYTLMHFPASEYLMITTDWMKTNGEAIGDNGNGRCNRYAETVSIPEGYVRYDGPGSPITGIEKENRNTPLGSRYEVWVPIKKC